MAKKRTMLKNLDMNSVDFVRRGANQKADIMLYKSAPPEEDEIPQDLLKSIIDSVKTWWNKENAGDTEFSIEKSSYFDAIDYSLESIMKDDSMTIQEKADMAIESIGQFADALAESVCKSLDIEYEPHTPLVTGTYGAEEQILEDALKSILEDETTALERANLTEEGEGKMKIDKSRFSEHELQMYQALIAKGKVDEDEEIDYEEELEKEEEEMEKTTKSAEMHPEVAKALAEIEEMKKGMEMKEMHEVAKSFSVLGKNEEKLANTLYETKKSSPENYEAYVALLNEQVSMVEKSGLFAEIGKSSRGYVTGGDVEDKINAIALDIQKADPSINRYDAIQKAWDQNPDMLAEYEKAYAGGAK